jgi:hypothetical protein
MKSRSVVSTLQFREKYKGKCGAYPNETIVEHHAKQSGCDGGVTLERVLYLLEDDRLHIRTRLPVVRERELSVHFTHAQ